MAQQSASQPPEAGKPPGEGGYTAKGESWKPSRSALIRFVKTLARAAARRDHEAAMSARKGPRKRVLKPRTQD
jgi:hypothetical protein